MCLSRPTIQKADPVAPPPPPPADSPKAPVLNEASRTANSEGRSAQKARRGKSMVTIPLIGSGGSGVNIPR
jgi:hypothetical protein